MSTLKSRMLTKWTGGAILGSAVEVGLTTYTAYDSRKQGDNILTTVGKVGIDIASNALLQGVGNWIYAGATIGYDLTLQTAKQNAEFQKQMKYTGSGRMGSGHFNMSGAGYTMRQRAINQIRQNGQNINSVLGNEARNYLKSSQTYT